jgi:hypothetical protein
MNTIMKHIQHTIKKNFHIPYQQGIILDSETLFQSALQQSNLPYVFFLLLIVFVFVFDLLSHLVMFIYHFFITVFTFRNSFSHFYH